MGAKQFNAEFSVPGTATYSLNRGFKPEPGNFQLTVTFTPDDRVGFMMLSTTRTIQVAAKSTPTASATPTISASPVPVSKPAPTPKPATIKVSELRKIGVVYFNNNEYFLDSRDRSALTDVSMVLNRNNYKTVVIQGNTDLKLGVDNTWLSRARAEAVSKFLTKAHRGPLYNRVWYAAKRPAAIGLDKKALALNRRVEIYAQVVTEQPVSVVPSISKNPANSNFQPISFNRNESFLDASDRNSLVSATQAMAKLGCTHVYLRGSHDQTKSSVNSYIGKSRVNAVKKFISELLPSLKFTVEPEFISAERVVQIRCTN